MSVGYEILPPGRVDYLQTVAGPHDHPGLCDGACLWRRREALKDLTIAGEIDYDPLRDRGVPAPWEVP